MDYKKFYNLKYSLLIGVLLFIGCEPNQYEKVYIGQTQGTTYSIKTISSTNENLQPAIDSVLKAIDLTRMYSKKTTSSQLK